MTTLILAFALAQTKTVTFSHPCASSAVVLEALGKELGVQMKPSGSVMKDFIIVRFDQVPVEEAMKRLADGINATWTQSNGVNYLTRTALQENNEKRDAKAAAAKLIQDWLDKRKVEGQVTIEGATKLIEDVLPTLKANPGGNFDQQAYERQRELEKGGPLSRYLTRILKEIGAQSLSDIEEGERVQYVIDPTPKQRKLPDGEAFKQFTIENEIYKEALMRTGARERLNSEGSMYSSLIHPYMDYYGETKSTVLTVHRQRNMYSVRFEIVGHGSVQESIQPDREKPEGMPKELLEQKGDYEPTQIERELGNVAKVIFGGRGDSVPVSAAAVGVLSDPVTNEPLTVFGSKWLIDSSKAMGKNLVGVMSDDCYLAGMFIVSQEKMGFGQFWTFLPQMGTGYNVKIEDKWLTLYPKGPIEVRENRLDREEWKRAIARGAPGRQATLEELASFAALSDDEMSVMIATLPAVFMGHGISMDQLQRDGNMQALRLFGRLTALQQKATRNGGAEMLLSRLPVGPLRAVDSLVNGQNAKIGQDRAVIGWGEPHQVYASGTDSDPLRLLPRGYPPASVVRVYAMKKDVVHQQRGTGYGRSEGVLPDTIAQQMAYAEVWPESYQYMLPLFAMSSAEQLFIEFEFTNVGFMYHRMQVDFLPKDTVFKPLKDLPAGVRGEIEAALKKYREQYKNIKRDGGG